MQPAYLLQKPPPLLVRLNCHLPVYNFSSFQQIKELYSDAVITEKST